MLARDDLQDVVGLQQDRLFEGQVIRYEAIERSTRLTGESRYSKSSSAIRAASLAPNPHVNWSSCVTTTRRVREELPQQVVNQSDR